MSDSTYDIGEILEFLKGMGTQLSPAISSDISSFAITGSDTVLAFNETRRGFILWNNDNPIYLKLGVNISTLSFTVILRAPAFFSMDNYGGAVSVLPVGSPSNIKITELY